MASINSHDSGSSATAVRTAFSKAPRPTLPSRMPNAFSEWQMAFSRSMKLAFRLLRWVSRSFVR
jgi:hypothetical protein